MKRALGIDLGGTKIEAALVDFDESSVQASIRQRIATERELGYQHVLSQCEKLVHSVIEAAGWQPSAIGIGIPGAVDPVTGTVRNANTTCLNGNSLEDDLAARLDIPVHSDNDANCFALAESRFGSGRGSRVVLGVILGTGVGAGIVIDGKVWNGALGIAGEWGHTVIEPDGLPCWCGKQGCVEQYLSGPATEAAYRALSGEFRSLESISQQPTSDEAASSVMARYYRYFGLALSNVINVLDPDTVVLGGGLSQIDRLYSDGHQAILSQVFHPRPRLDLRRPTLGDSAGVFGAAMLVPEMATTKTSLLT